MTKKINTEFWKNYSFVMRSKQRKLIVKIMTRPMTVTELKNKSTLSLSETSRVLRALKTEAIAECVNPGDALGRVYKLSGKGEKLRKKMINLKLI